MAAATAIYLNTHTALAVRVEGSAKKPKITRAAELTFELPSPGPDGAPPSADDVIDSKAAQLKSWLKKSKLYGGPIALCVDSSHVILRDLRVSFTERRQIDKVIAFQVEGVIPSTPVEDLAVGYTILDKDDEGSRLLVAAAHRGPLRDQLDLLEDIGIEPETADSTVSGALNLRSMCPALAKVDKPTLWIDLHGTNAVVSVLEGTSLLSLRSIRIPNAAAVELAAGVVADSEGNGVPASSSADGESSADDDEEVAIVDYEEETTDPSGLTSQAKSTATSSGTRLNNVPVAAGDALVRLLTIEARRTILGAQAGGPIERVVITGVPDSMRASVAPVKRELGVREFEVLNLIDFMLVKDKYGKPKVKMPSSLLLAPAAGVGCKLLGADASGVDFLTGDLSPTDTFDQFKSPMAIAATLLFMVSGIMLMLVLNENRRIEREAQDLVANLELDSSIATAYAVAPEVRRQNLPEVGFDFAAVNAAHDKLTAEVTAIKAGNKKLFPPMYEADSALDQILRTINATIGETMPDGKKNLVHFWLKNISFSQEPARGTTGTTGKIEILGYIESSPDPKRFALSDALQKIEVRNPNYDGINDRQQFIKLISNITVTPDGNKVFARGQRKVKGQRVAIEFQPVTFSCELTELKKVSPVAGPGGSTRRR